MPGHPNAPLTPAGRRRLCERVDAGRPISHVAAEAGISRRCLAKWYARYRADGEDGLHDHSSRPDASPTQTADDVADLVEAMRRQSKHGAARLAADLARLHGVAIAPSTVHRILVRRGISHLRDLDPPTGHQMREIVRYEYGHPGDMIHVDIKKLGRIPDGGGWHSHGRDSDAARASKRKGAGTGRVGYVYLHSAVDDHSRLAYTESLPNEKAATAVAFWHRAVAFFAAHGITRIVRCLTDNGSCYRSREWGANPRRDGHPPQEDQAVHASDEREGRAIQRHPGPRVGLRPAIRQRGRTDRGARRLPELLQPRPAPLVDRAPAAGQPHSRFGAAGQCPARALGRRSRERAPWPDDLVRRVTNVARHDS